MALKTRRNTPSVPKPTPGTAEKSAGDIPPNIRHSLAKMQIAADTNDAEGQMHAKATMQAQLGELDVAKREKVVAAIQKVISNVSPRATV